MNLVTKSEPQVLSSKRLLNSFLEPKTLVSAVEWNDFKLFVTKNIIPLIIDYFHVGGMGCLERWVKDLHYFICPLKKLLFYYSGMKYILPLIYINKELK